MSMIYLYQKDLVLPSLIKVYASIQTYQLAVLKVVNYSFQNARSSPNFLHVIELDDFTKLLTSFSLNIRFSQRISECGLKMVRPMNKLIHFLTFLTSFFPLVCVLALTS